MPDEPPPYTSAIVASNRNQCLEDQQRLNSWYLKNINEKVNRILITLRQVEQVNLEDKKINNNTYAYSVLFVLNLISVIVLIVVIHHLWLANSTNFEFMLEKSKCMS